MARGDCTHQNVLYCLSVRRDADGGDLYNAFISHAHQEHLRMCPDCRGELIRMLETELSRLYALGRNKLLVSLLTPRVQ